MRYSRLSHHIQVNIFAQKNSVIGNNPNHTWEKSKTKDVVSNDTANLTSVVQYPYTSNIYFSILQLVFLYNQCCCF
jgi:hypothetical protein